MERYGILLVTKILFPEKLNSVVFGVRNVLRGTAHFTMQLGLTMFSLKDAVSENNTEEVSCRTFKSISPVILVTYLKQRHAAVLCGISLPCHCFLATNYSAKKLVVNTAFLSIFFIAIEKWHVFLYT